MSDKAALVRLIQDRPGILAVQVADAVDMETPAAENMLLELIDEKLVQSHMITGPNGKATRAYTLVGVPLPTAHDKAMEALKENDDGPALTYGEKAVRFLVAKGGEASTEELHRALGLAPNRFVSTFLSSAVKGGLVNKDGQNWKLGRGPLADKQVPKSTGNFATIKPPLQSHEPVAEFHVKPKSSAPDSKPESKPLMAVSAPVSPLASNGINMDAVHKDNNASSSKSAVKVTLSDDKKSGHVEITQDPPSKSSPVQQPPINWLKLPSAAIGVETASIMAEAPIVASLLLFDAASNPTDIEITEDQITFGIWSNGEFHIAHEGILLLKLSSKKLKEMHAYLDKARMLL